MFNHPLEMPLLTYKGSFSNGKLQASILESVPFRGLVHHSVPAFRSVPFRRIVPTESVAYQSEEYYKTKSCEITDMLQKIWEKNKKVYTNVMLQRALELYEDHKTKHEDDEKALKETVTQLKVTINLLKKKSSEQNEVINTLKEEPSNYMGSDYKKANSKTNKQSVGNEESNALPFMFNLGFQLMEAYFSMPSHRQEPWRSNSLYRSTNTPSWNSTGRLSFLSPNNGPLSGSPTNDVCSIL